MLLLALQKRHNVSHLGLSCIVCAAAVQVPVRHQLLVVNTFSLLDAAFISWVGNQEGWYTKILDRMGLSGSTIGSNKEQ